MSVPITIPSISTPSAGSSPSSDDSSQPRTPPPLSTIPPALTLSTSPEQLNNQAPQQNSGASQMKRKPSRRANTAERRATHNAVERQRRETLNGRFLDLAALLPNLSQIRRPSKSAIVNSSIAHIHASRRHRLLASRELRLLKLEADALRRELNEWRDRAALPRVEEPVRSEGFTMVLSGEVEVLAAVVGEDDEEGGDYEDSDDFAGVQGNVPIPADEPEDMRMSQSAAIQMLKNANANPFAHNLPTASTRNGMPLAQILPRPTQHGGPMIASSPTSVSFENPAMTSLYEPNQGPFSAQFLQQMGQDTDKWNYHSHQMQHFQAQRGIYTPSSAHGNAPTGFNDTEFMATFQRQHMMAMQQQMGHMYGSPDGDDSSSVGSVPGMMQQNIAPPINVGGGGNGNGFAMMM